MSTVEFVGIFGYNIGKFINHKGALFNGTTKKAN